MESSGWGEPREVTVSMPSITLFSVGHSNLSTGEFLQLLSTHQIAAVVDIRRFPGSRKYPHFNRDQFSAMLQEHGIAYHWIGELGGRRSPRTDYESPNGGLRNTSFRNYADYMATEEFRAGFKELTGIARRHRTALMCAESVYWRCHRRLVSDLVVAQGGSVQHIFPSGEAKPHQLTDTARVEDGSVTYPGPPTLFGSA